LGERCARAPVIAYLDADDAWQPGKLAAQLEVLEQNPRCGVVFTGRSLMDDLGQPLAANPDQTHTDYPQGRIGPDLFLRNQICFSSVMIRKVVFDHLGGFDPQLDLAIDYDFWLRVSNYYDFQALADPWTIYRTGHANLSGKQLDRVATAEFIMTRACRRGILGLSKSDRAEGFASLYRAAAYTLRGIESATARAWARRALWANPRSLFSWKLWLSTFVPRRAAATRPENRSENR
jgi:glycosyltransferase involved in cell wall biosynthesis